MFFSKYSKYIEDNFDLKTYVGDKLISLDEVDSFKDDLFIYLSKKNVSGLYFDVLNAGGFDITVMIGKLVSKNDLDFLKEKITSYYGIYQKTKNISTIFLFDDKENLFIELSSGSLDGDELIISIADGFKKEFNLPSSEFVCDVLEHYDDDYNEFID